MIYKKALLSVSLLALVGALAFGQSINIIPKPASLVPKEGHFVLDSGTRIYYQKGKPEWSNVANELLSIILPSTGFRLQAQSVKRNVPIARDNSIYILENKDIANDEGYTIDIQPKTILIHAKNPSGAYYAVQTLRQVFPPEINSSTLQANHTIWSAPCCKIEDYPRFGYRGLMLDVSRHFYGVQDVKRFIDLLAMHKFNTFHWHLTDDQGWRIEIDKYPRLQTVGSCRNETLSGHYSDEPEKYDGTKHCGYYTKEDIKEVIDYAQKHFVTIIPEIEMPGHAVAALASYPELGCTGGPYEVFKKWGVNEEVFCAGNDKTFEFIENVLAEVCELFPSKYVHVGGDECPKERWKKCPKCQKRMKDNGLKDEHELQSYVIKRAEKILASHGKKLIGWDEILEGGLTPTATVMSWRGIAGGVAAAKAGHDVIMSPTDNCYLDYYQSSPDNEPLAIGGYLPIEKVYSYEPIPTELTPEEGKYIKGVQANLWTEYIGEMSKVEYMVWPRACAIAETGWTSKDLKDWKDFAKRIKRHFVRFDVMQVAYGKGFYDLRAAFEKGKITFASNDPGGADIRYTLDGTAPTASSPIYKEPFQLEKSAELKAAIFQNTQKSGNTLTVQYLMHKAAGKPYTLSHAPEKFTGGEQYGLTNGVLGAPKKWNAWVALDGQDLDPTIDLGTQTEISKVTTHFLNSKISWVHPPRAIEIFGSNDGQNFTSLGKKNIDADGMTGISIETVSFDLNPTQTRYLKLVATNYGKIPASYPGEGNTAWVFLDEIIVE